MEEIRRDVVSILEGILALHLLVLDRRFNLILLAILSFPVWHCFIFHVLIFRLSNILKACVG